MKQTPIVLMIDNNKTNNLLKPAHNYANKSNLLGKYLSLIFHSGSVATIICSNDLKNRRFRR